MIAIYRNNKVINLVTVAEWLNMTNASLVGNASEYATCSLINFKEHQNDLP